VCFYLLLRPIGLLRTWVQAKLRPRRRVISVYERNTWVRWHFFCNYSMCDQFPLNNKESLISFEIPNGPESARFSSPWPLRVCPMGRSACSYGGAQQVKKNFVKQRLFTIYMHPEMDDVYWCGTLVLYALAQPLSASVSSSNQARPRTNIPRV
jgi:hypothetical protein